MVVFNGRPWEELHDAGGGVYADLPGMQASWESNRGRAGRFGIITDYASGERGAALELGPGCRRKWVRSSTASTWCWKAPRHGP